MSCPDCTTGGLLAGEPTGIIDAQGAYFAAAPTPTGDERGTSKRAIILLTDAFGLPLKNCKIMADIFAKRLECDVWVPDLFAGRPVLGLGNLVLPERAGQKMSLFKWLKFIFTVIPSIPAVISSRASVVDGRLSDFFKMLHEQKAYNQIGAVGYCFGGAAAVRLGSTDFVQSVVIVHPGRFSIAQVQAIKVPAAWACAEDDMFFSTAKQLECEAIFSQRKGSQEFIEYEFCEYKGSTHGFAIRPNLAYPEIKEAFEKAIEQTVNWFSKTLPVIEIN